MEIGKRLLEIRKEKGYPQKDVASILKLTRQTIGKQENGKSIPSVYKIVLLSKIYDIKMVELLRV